MTTCKSLSTRPPKASGRHFVKQSIFSQSLEWICFILLFLPHIFFAFFTHLFPPKGKNLDGKVVLVVGAGDGLGRELALTFAGSGCKLACVDIHQQNAVETAAEILRDGEIAKAYFTDISNAEDIKALHDEVAKGLGVVDVLVFPASSNWSISAVEDASDQSYQTGMQQHFLNFIKLVHEFLPKMKERDSGHIVCVVSTAALSSFSNGSIFSSSQCAIAGFMDSLRSEVLDEGFQNIYFTTMFHSFANNQQRKLDFNYWQRWTCKSLEEIAFQTVVAVRRNYVINSIPSYLYFILIFSKLLPWSIRDWSYRLTSWSRIIQKDEARS